MLVITRGFQGEVPGIPTPRPLDPSHLVSQVAPALPSHSTTHVWAQ